MCGISGILQAHGKLADPGRLIGMVTALSHRGPDARGVYCDREAGLAHARLSVIDLEGGGQPMSTVDGKLTITFNGEIFNYVELREELIQKGHKFRTRSDTEVLLHLYQQEGEECVQKLNGQWAFAIWDADQHKLFLSRDRMGVRPLFYTWADGAFLFASEIKALFTCPEVERALDLLGLDQIFTFWVTLPPRTAFRNISQLPPGHSMVVQEGRVRVQSYWNLEYAPDSYRAEDAENRLTADLLDLLLDATRIRLRSDVPVGTYLSGGLDSTLIAALTRSLAGDRLRTFSVSFADGEFDESAYQREACAFLRNQHSERHCTQQDIAAAFPEVIWHCEQPILRTAPAPLFLLSQLVRENGFKVVLSGEGADETLGGYDVFKEAKVRRFWARDLESRRRPLLLKRLYPYLEDLQKQSPQYLQRFFRVTPSDLVSPWFSHLPRWELTAKLKMFFSEEVRQGIGTSDAMERLDRALPPSFASWLPFNQAEYLEATMLLPGYILSSQGDRMAMAHSVESRHPFLDHRVVDFAAKLPPNLKMKVLDQKHLLKQAASGLIPASVQKRVKQPYRAPDGQALLGQGWDYVKEYLSPERLRRDGIFHPAAVAALVAKFATGRAHSTKDNMAAVAIVSTGLLIDQFIHPHPGSSLWHPQLLEKCTTSS